VCWPNSFSHLPAFNYKGLVRPPSTLAVELCYSETRACSLRHCRVNPAHTHNIQPPLPPPPPQCIKGLTLLRVNPIKAEAERRTHPQQQQHTIAQQKKLLFTPYYIPLLRSRAPTLLFAAYGLTWPIPDIVLCLGLCARINTILCEHTR